MPRTSPHASCRPFSCRFPRRSLEKRPVFLRLLNKNRRKNGSAICARRNAWHFPDVEIRDCRKIRSTIFSTTRRVISRRETATFLHDYSSKIELNCCKKRNSRANRAESRPPDLHIPPVFLRFLNREHVSLRETCKKCSRQSTHANYSALP